MSASIAFIIGSVLLAVANSVSLLLVGRAIVGAAVGKMWIVQKVSQIL